MQDGTETPRVMVSPDSSQSGPMILGGLQGMDGIGGTVSKEKEEAVKAEMGVMREDLELLRHAVQARKAGKLEVGELAEARQAANDCSGWLQRLSQLLGSSVGGQTTRRNATDALSSFSEATKEALRVLQQEMAELHRTFQAAYPGRKGFAMSGTPRASSTAGGAQAGALLQLGQTPRTREMFMANSDGQGTDRGGGNTLSQFFGVTGGTGAAAAACARAPSRRSASSSRHALTSHVARPRPRRRLSPPHTRRAPSRPPTPNAGARPRPSCPSCGWAAPTAARAAPLDLGRAPRCRRRSARRATTRCSLARPAGARPRRAARDCVADDEDYEPMPDASSQMFMQEVAILQMQAEGWKAEWSIAMQENERLRMALFDAESALESLPPARRARPTRRPRAAARTRCRRELCTSIRRATRRRRRCSRSSTGARRPRDAAHEKR